MNKGVKKLAVGTMIAGIAGYVAGVLTAPKSGKATREQIRTATNTSITESEKQLKRLHTELNELLSEAKLRSNDLKGQARVGMHDAMDVADVAKRKVREILSAVHEGDASDKDLEKAMKEAQKAIKHIKTYLKK